MAKVVNSCVTGRKEQNGGGKSETGFFDITYRSNFQSDICPLSKASKISLDQQPFG
jgi:hypothetical protein